MLVYKGQSYYWPPMQTDPSRREAFFDEAETETPYLAVRTRHGELLFMRSDDKRFGKLLFVGGWSKDVKFLHRAVTLLGEAGITLTGTTFVDVGANIGTTTVTALRRHGFSRAVAVEASPDNVQTLRINVAANDLGGLVDVFGAAVSDTEDDQDLFLSVASSGAHTVNLSLPRSGRSARTTVKAVTLNGLVARGEIDPAQIGLLWLDVPGTETRALAGASTLLEAGVPVVTAVRARKPYNWPETKPKLMSLLGTYTDFALLRGDAAERSTDLGRLLDGLSGVSDLLAFRRPAR